MTGMKLDAEDRVLFQAAIERSALLSVSIDQVRSGNCECDDKTWQAFAEQGLLGLGIAPDFGGIGGGAVDLALVTRHIGRQLLPAGFFDTVVLAATAIGQLGDDEQKRDLLPAIVEGKLRISFAHRESDSGDIPDHVGTTVRGDRLSGTKIHALAGTSADKFLVSARDETGSLRLYLVDRASPEVTCQHYRLPDNRMATRVILNDAPGVPLGGDATTCFERLFDLGSACLAAETVGAIEATNVETLNYAKIRKQFGQPIGSFQVIQHRLVDMFIAEQTAAALLDDALAALDSGSPQAKAIVSSAKAQADRTGRLVGESAIQIHGGMGMTDECSVGHYLKRILTNGSLFGTATWHIARIAETSG